MSADFTFLKGNIETIILRALYDNDKYGYELAKEIKEKTSNKYEIKQPTLYSYLKRLEDDGLIVSYWGESSNGGRRRYYKITKDGKENYEKFISEWNFQKTVLSDLVDGDVATTDLTQNDVTPLFGRKSAKRKTKSAYKSSLEEQDEISKRLSELLGGQKDDSRTATQTTLTTDTGETTPPKTTTLLPEIKYEESTDDAKARFEVKQDNAEVFLQNFEERAKEVSERQPEQVEGENYQHVLMSVLGDQLDDMQKTAELAPTASHYENDTDGLESVADSLAREGIRMRIYNHATAAYKSKLLIPLSRVLCQTAWIVYAIAVIYYGILALTTIWTPSVITMGVLIVVPIAFSIHAIVDPTRKDKPRFNFRITMIVSAAIAVIIIVASVGFSALGKIEFSNIADVSTKVLLPTGIALLVPSSVVVFYLFYKKY